MTEYKTHIQWPQACCPEIGNYSTDTHKTKEQAEGVINLLKTKGYGGEGKFFPERDAITEDTILHDIAEQVYDYALATRPANLTKEGKPGDPRKLGCRFAFLLESVQSYYRSIAEWHISHGIPADVDRQTKST